MSAQTYYRSHAAERLLRELFVQHGHLSAHLNPLTNPPPRAAELERAVVEYRELVSPLLVGQLRQAYCGTVAAEIAHLDEQRRQWLSDRLEHRAGEPMPADQRVELWATLARAEELELFLRRRFPSERWFSLEGLEVLVPVLLAVIDRAAVDGVEEVRCGMAHRGRLNVLAGVFGKPLARIFAGFGAAAPAGDVKYHTGWECDRPTAGGRAVRLVLSPNPSHLEAVAPVVLGAARGREEVLGRGKVLGVLVRGDAALPGQGVATEAANLANLPGYASRGAIHLVANNQIGFTTEPEDARGTRYCTDFLRASGLPVLHVNADDPDACVWAAAVAVDYRQRFGTGFVIDIVGYRRRGHNELDEPAFTQPVRQARINAHPPVAARYRSVLEADGDLRPVDADLLLDNYRLRLASEFDRRQEEGPVADPAAVPASPLPDRSPDEIGEWLTALTRLPPGFTPHPGIRRVLAARREAVASDKIDWATAETLAFADLLRCGRPVRLTGQDVGRGTFSQRHAVLHDSQTGARWCPLAALGPFEAHDSPLSEFACVGFEYGYSVARPEAFVAWEAQFGDFVNGAQVAIDQFIAAGHEKWGLRSRLVLLLPHGYDGMGPEHSSSRFERFLPAAVGSGLWVCQPTTAAQHFHLLREQAAGMARPLVVLTPKSLLRQPATAARLDELVRGRFRPVIADDGLPRESVRQVVLCSGKLYFDLLARRTELNRTDVAVVRVEQLAPLPADALRAAVAEYPAAAEVVWAQEEPINQGAWDYLGLRAAQILGRVIRPVGRPAAASPATGSRAVHLAQQSVLIDRALGTSDRDSA